MHVAFFIYIWVHYVVIVAESKCIFTSVNGEKSNKYWLKIDLWYSSINMLKIKLKIWIAAFSWIIYFFAMLSVSGAYFAIQHAHGTFLIIFLSYLQLVGCVTECCRKSYTSIFLGRWSQCTMVMLVISLLLWLGFCAGWRFFSCFVVVVSSNASCSIAILHMCARVAHT